MSPATAIATPPANTASQQASPSPSKPARVRLHIKPFNPDLLKTYVPAPILAVASDISYHTIETFPEKGFGYIELPAMEAQKLKQKLNGSILKGSRVKVNEAKPEKRKAQQEALKEEEEPVEDVDRPKKRRMKEKRQEGVIPAIKLPGDRKVKRGWTEPPSKEKKKSKDKDRKKQEPSKYTTEPELLFRTKLPPNKIALVKESTKESKDKKRKSKKSARDVTVHEFAKTTKQATFLRSQSTSGAKPAAEYIEGKGWVDEEGNVVEEEKKRKRNFPPQQSPETSSGTLDDDQVETAKYFSEDKDEESSSSDSGVEEEPQRLSKTQSTKAKATLPSLKIQTPSKPSEPAVESDDSDSDSSILSSSSVVSSSSSESESDSESDSDASDASSTKPAEESAPASASIPTPPTTATTPHEVHPLEALFKRPKPVESPSTSHLAKLAPINTSFSFFGADGDDEEDAEEPSQFKEPFTPFTKQDMQWRASRSAAPTPDTAAIGKRFKLPWKDEDEDEYDEMDMDDQHQDDVDANATPLGAKSAKPNLGEKEGEETEFAKWFWEHRGETNRAWKQRRREALKVKRQRENRKLSRRMV